MDNAKAIRTRSLRYKRPALASLGYEFITNELYDIQCACDDVRYFVENDQDTLLNALDGDDEAEWEFRMAFSDLENKAEELSNQIGDWTIRDDFDDCTVGLLGRRYKTVGFDSEEEDYFALTSFEQELAQTEAGKRLMRKTKPEIISTVGQCLGITIAFLDVRQQYDYLKATFDILRDENTAMLQVIKAIEAAYKDADEAEFREWDESTKIFDHLLTGLPQRTWLE